jgi:osmotically-inducible protein OsmY
MARAATGPHRTDANLFAEARKALDDCPSVPATVRVHIDDGVAWLTGMARRTSERAAAENIVRQVPGIERVVNKITVAQPGAEGFEPPDA